MPGGFPLGPELCNGNDVGSDTTTSLGTSLTGGAANAYNTTYTTLVASAPYDTCWVGGTIIGQNASSNTGAIRIAIGAAGFEKIIIPDLVYNDAATQGGIRFGLPIHIKAGTRISAATQTPTASDGSAYINLQLFDGSFTQYEGFGGVDSIGFVAASTFGTAVTASATGNTKGSYAQLIASTARDYAGFCLALDSQNTSWATGFSALLDIAIGAAGSEKIILPNFAFYGSLLPQPAFAGPFFVPIKAGTRLAARLQTSLASAQVVGLTLYGIYQ